MNDPGSSSSFSLDAAQYDVGMSRIQKPLQGLIVTSNRKRGQDLRRKLRRVNAFLPISLHHQPESIEDLDYLIETERAAILFLNQNRIRLKNLFVGENSDA